MSGPICPECGHPGLTGGMKTATCELCGWGGDVSGHPRAIIPAQAYERAARRAEEKRAGRLFFVLFEAPEESDAVFGAMEILGAQGAASQGTRHRIELTVRPTDDQLDAVRRIPGVSNVRVS